MNYEQDLKPEVREKMKKNLVCRWRYTRRAVDAPDLIAHSHIAFAPKYTDLGKVRSGVEDHFVRRFVVGIVPRWQMVMQPARVHSGVMPKRFW